MLDSVKLQSPHLSESVACEIERRLVYRSAVDRSTGELLYELTSGQLQGSWDHRISLRVLRTKFIPDPSDKRGNRMLSVACAPYLWLEGSIHKAIMGHNVYGGPVDFEAPCRWFVEDLGERLGVELPSAVQWIVMRIDWAEAFGMPYEVISAYIRSLNACDFPRRSVDRYGDQSLLSHGATSALKLYHKGPEFFKHDFKRLVSVLEPRDMKELMSLANETLRAEVAIKKRKIVGEYGGDPLVEWVELDWIKRVYAGEIMRLLREGASRMKIVRDAHNVKARLESLYSDRQAASLFATWVQLAALGERAVRESMRERRRTFYDHRSKLVGAGVAWTGTDVVIGSSGVSVPADFVPLASDPRCVFGEDVMVREKLAPFRAA